MPVWVCTSSSISSMCSSRHLRVSLQTSIPVVGSGDGISRPGRGSTSICFQIDVGVVAAPCSASFPPLLLMSLMLRRDSMSRLAASVRWIINCRLLSWWGACSYMFVASSWMSIPSYSWDWVQGRYTNGFNWSLLPPYKSHYLLFDLSCGFWNNFFMFFLRSKESKWEFKTLKMISYTSPYYRV